MRTRRALQSSRPVAIIGLQRTGKSSLALESIRRLRDETKSLNLVTFDFRRLRDETLMPQEDLALEFARQLATDIGNEETESVINTYLASTSKGGPAEQRGFFRRILVKSAELKRRTILFIDECQEIAEFLNENRYKSFFDFVDSLCKESQLELTIVLVSRPSFFELDPIKNINLGRLFEIISLGPLEEEAAKAVIDKGSGQLTFTPAARERLLYLTGRHAFWLQFLCHRIFENSVLSNNVQISDIVVDQVFSTILTDPGCKPQFYLLYQEVDHDEDAFELLKIIAAAAPNEGSVVNLVALFPDQANMRQIGKGLKKLVDNQIVVIEDPVKSPAVRFQVEALRSWLRRNLLTL
jgi:predicted AAA+ superfamily ATPase